MLGGAMDAEDLLQETFLQWQQTALSKIRSPKAFLATVVRNLCLNQLQSARVRKEDCLESLEKLATVESLTGCDPETAASLTDSLCLALRLLFERLPPKERLVFLLREVFDYEYEEIAKVLRKSSTNCRQILVRAKRHIMSDSLRFIVSPEQLNQLIRQFTLTCATGDVDGLVCLMS
jgi:RNA polymerase sigma-70 factor (ECF subfamily)